MTKCKMLCRVDDATCRPGDIHLRLDGQRLYLFAPVRKSQMQCPNKDDSVDEVEFLSPAYLERQR